MGRRDLRTTKTIKRNRRGDGRVSDQRPANEESAVLFSPECGGPASGEETGDTSGKNSFQLRPTGVSLLSVKARLEIPGRKM